MTASRSHALLDARALRGWYGAAQVLFDVDLQVLAQALEHLASPQRRPQAHQNASRNRQQPGPQAHCRGQALEQFGGR